MIDPPAAGRRRPFGSTLTFWVGVLSACVGVVTTLARSTPASWLPVPSDDWAIVTSFTDFGIVAYAVSLVALSIAVLLRTSWTPVVVGGLVLALAVLHGSWIVPWFVPDRVRPTATTPVLTILSLNMELGGADPAMVVAAAQRVDVLVLVEATQPAHDALRRAGITNRLPYERAGTLPESGSSGTTVLSRLPITATSPLPGDIDHQHWLVRIAVPGAGDIDLAAVHPTRPFRGGTAWSSDQRHLRTAIEQTRPSLVAGDFNAVDNHVALRRLAADGYRSTTDSAGVGWQPTWPADRPDIPPVMPIDHILLARGWAASDSHTVRVSGTDHLGVEATVGRVAT